MSIHARTRKPKRDIKVFRAECHFFDADRALQILSSAEEIITTADFVQCRGEVRKPDRDNRRVDAMLSLVDLERTRIQCFRLFKIRRSALSSQGQGKV